MSRTHHSRKKRGAKNPMPKKALRVGARRKYMTFVWHVQPQHKNNAKNIADIVDDVITEYIENTRKLQEISICDLYDCRTYTQMNKYYLEFIALPSKVGCKWATWIAHQLGAPDRSTLNFL